MDTRSRMEDHTSLVFTLVIMFYLIHNISGFQPGGYQGCYFHIFYTPALTKQFATEQSNTGDVCINICRLKAYKYAGVRSGECYCDNTVHTQKYTSGCDITCPGRATEKCGGLLRVSIYTVQAEETTSTPFVTKHSEYTKQGTSNSTSVPESSELEGTSSTATAILLIVAILSIVSVAAFIAVRKRRSCCSGRAYTISGNISLKRYFDSNIGNYERHQEDDNRLPDVTVTSNESNPNSHVSSLDTPIYSKINKQHASVNMQVYNHITDDHRPTVGKTYSPLSTVGRDFKTIKIIDTYAHISEQKEDEPDNCKDVKKDHSYSTLHAVATSFEEEQFNDDISTMYDRTHVFDHKEVTDEVDEYSHTNHNC